jgi:hypothetical protein
VDYYALLGVPRDATETEIRAAYGRRALALQTSGVAADPTERARLDAALAMLTDPEMRAAYDRGIPSAAVTAQASAPDPVAMASAAFAYARNGALWFTGGALLTAATYIGAKPGGSFTIAWGAVLFGAFRLFSGLSVYLRAPAAGRTRGQMAGLGVLVAIGILAGASVLVPQARSAQSDTELKQWNSAIDAAQVPVDQATALYKAISARTGAWSAQDSADAANMSELYRQAADALAKAPPVADSVWYRDALVKNYHDASDIMASFARLPTPVSQAEFQALDQRWTARVTDLKQIEDRLTAQTAK